MTAPDVLRSMAAHPSSQRPKIAHVSCPFRTEIRLCGTPTKRQLSPDEFRSRQLCVVCEELMSHRCPHCGRMHPAPS